MRNHFPLILPSLGRQISGLLGYVGIIFFHYDCKRRKLEIPLEQYTWRTFTVSLWISLNDKICEISQTLKNKEDLIVVWSPKNPFPIEIRCRMIVASSECGLWRKNTQWQDKVQEILYREWWLQFIIIHCIIEKILSGCEVMRKITFILLQ